MGTLVVEHKDQLSRVGFGWFDVPLELQARRKVLAAATEEKLICSTTSCRSSPASAARLYGPRSARRRTEVIAALRLAAVAGAELVTG
jgi:putative resolvase